MEGSGLELANLPSFSLNLEHTVSNAARMDEIVISVIMAAMKRVSTKLRSCNPLPAEPCVDSKGASSA